jgi:hypothetical protein
MERPSNRPAEHQLGFQFVDLPELKSAQEVGLPFATENPPPFTDSDYPIDLEFAELEDLPDSILYDNGRVLDALSVNESSKDIEMLLDLAKRYIYLRLDLLFNPPTGQLPRIADEAFVHGIKIGRLKECREVLFALGQDSVVSQVELEILRKFKPLRI